MCFLHAHRAAGRDIGPARQNAKVNPPDFQNARDRDRYCGRLRGGSVADGGDAVGHALDALGDLVHLAGVFYFHRLVFARHALTGPRNLVEALVQFGDLFFLLGEVVEHGRCRP